MIFNSITYFVFLSVFVPLFYFVPGKYKIYILHFASITFLLNFNPEQLLLIVVVIFLNYYGAMVIFNSVEYKKLVFVLLISCNIFILLCFKYLNFLIDNFAFLLNGEVLKQKSAFIKILIPIGLSFITFKSISYIIEVYRGNLNPEKSLAKYSLYIIFFPTVLAGPIDRPNSLISQYGNSSYGLESGNIEKGVFYILLGLFQKTVIADRLMYFVNNSFTNYENLFGLSLILVIFLFSIQIYCDFAGYSNIALGSARLFGIEVMQNFKTPYFSKSISEFWRRWHISLSTWLRDYLFLPLAYYFARKFTVKKYSKNKTENLSYILGIMITMFLAGAWHGASWSFIIWGSMIGFYMVFGFLTRKIRRKLWRKLNIGFDSKFKGFIQTVFTFSLVTFSWIFFKSENVNQAVTIIKNIFTDIFSFSSSISPNELFFSIAVIFIYFIFEYLNYKEFFKRNNLIRLNLTVKTLIAFAAFIFIILFGYFSSSQFIYFKF